LGNLGRRTHLSCHRPTLSPKKEGYIFDHYGHYVMLFNEFVTIDRTVPNVTRIRFIKASGIDWKVNEWEYLLLSIDNIQEEWYGIKYATNLITLELASSFLNGRRTDPYVPRTRSEIALYINMMIPRHRNWFIIFSITSITINLLHHTCLHAKKGLNKLHELIC